MIKDFKQEIKITIRRTWVVCLLILIAACMILSRIAYLQIIEHKALDTLSDGNRILIQSIPPTRGLIFDSHGHIIANNKPSFTLYIIPQQLKNAWPIFISDLKKIITITDDELNYFNRIKNKHKSFESIPLKYNLTDTEIARIAVNQYRLPGLKVTAQLIREYPDGHLFSHVLGYVGRINTQEQKMIDQTQYTQTHVIGKTGLEKFYEPQLLGYPGYREVEVDVSGRTGRILKQIAPQSGQSLELYLDRNLQKAASDALGNKRGAVVAIDPRSGGILVFVSKPTFNPNLFVTGINFEQYKQLKTDKTRPLFNRATLGNYPPASTLKPIIALAALDQDLITPGWELFDPGYYQLPGFEHKYRNWKRTGQGRINLHTAIMKSNDTYFYQLAVKLGINNIHKYTTLFGYGQRPDLDFPAMSSGLVPSKTWKKNLFQQPWYPGETVITGIGQGYMQTTPLQMALATSIIANRGRIVAPKLAKTRETSLSNYTDISSLISPLHWDIVINAMQAAISPQGTGWRMQKTPFSIAGKTGTAQVIRVAQGEVYDKSKLKKTNWDHGLFIAFAPVKNPEIALAIVVENEHNAAVLVAKKVLETYFKNAQETQQ